MRLNSSQNALIVLGIGALLTIGYHILLVEWPNNIPLAIFVIILIAAAIALSRLRAERPNAWAYLFLIPAGLTLVAEILYASSIVSLLGFIILLVTLALFAFWLTMPHTPLKEVSSLWTSRFVIETIAPFPALRSFAASISTGKKSLHILSGVLLATPFLFLIGSLFASADPLFYKVITGIFTNWDFTHIIQSGLKDIFFGFFFVASGWAMFTRTREQTVPRATDVPLDLNPTTLPTALVLINTLFLLFLAFQIPYFFGDQAFVQKAGLAYAEYARSGFFQLILVAGIVFIIALGVYTMTQMRHRLDKILTLALIAQTYVVMLSATTRLSLYTDAYGLTLSRWWAGISILIIALVLTLFCLAVIARIHAFQLVKMLIFVALLSVSIPLTLNAERLVTEHNIRRFQSGQTKTVDLNYLLLLSSDAVPALVRLYAQLPKDLVLTGMSSPAAKILSENLVVKREALNNASKDWRNLVVSDYQAIAALAGLK